MGDAIAKKNQELERMHAEYKAKKAALAAENKKKVENIVRDCERKVAQEKKVIVNLKEEHAAIVELLRQEMAAQRLEFEALAIAVAMEHQKAVDELKEEFKMKILALEEMMAAEAL